MEKQTKLALLRLMRILVGALFIFSGFVKCVDPAGGAIKIEDYFVAWGWTDAPWGLCLTLSVIQNIAEFSVGIMLLFGAYLNISALIAMLFMIFYTPLTLYIAIADPVSDCGCFGDAVKLTNWQTFWKNMVFLPMSILVYLWRKLEYGSNRGWRKLAMSGCGVALALLVTIKGLTDEPMIDFRPYSVGTDIRVAMSIPEDAPLTEYKTTFLLEKDGEIKEFDENNYPYDDSTWVYRDTKTIVLKQGYEPSIKDFTFTDPDGNEYGEDLLSSTQPVLLAISPKIENVSDDDLKKLGHQCQLALQNDFSFYVATSSAEAEFAHAIEIAEAPLAFLLADETMLKTIARSNPAILVLQNGIITAKYSINHMPFDKDMASPTSTYIKGIERSYDWLQVTCLAMVVVIVGLMLHRRHRRRKEEEPM